MFEARAMRGIAVGAIVYAVATLAIVLAAGPGDTSWANMFFTVSIAISGPLASLAGAVVAGTGGQTDNRTR